jgi:hypothetical protein
VTDERNWTAPNAFMDENGEVSCFSVAVDGKWRLAGWDVFSNEDYDLDGEHETEALALEAARKRLEELEVLQPTASSGGQAPGGIQDRVYVARPDGTRYRVTLPMV